MLLSDAGCRVLVMMMDEVGKWCRRGKRIDFFRLMEIMERITEDFKWQPRATDQRFGT